MKKFFTYLLYMTVLASLSACDPQTREETKEGLEEAAQETDEALQEAAQGTKEAAKDVADEVREELNENSETDSTKTVNKN